MYFNSYLFILLFFPVLLAGYYLLNRFTNHTLGKVWLLLGSAVFYLCYGLEVSWVILLSMIINYSSYLLIRKNQAKSNPNAVKTIRNLAVTANILLLGVFKYAMWLGTVAGTLFKNNFNMIHIIAPIGISFFTFTQISFIMDVAKDDDSNYNLLDYTLFTLFFAKILSGPIVTARSLIPQFNDKERKSLNFENFSKGLYAFSFGLAKKVLLADFFAIIVDFSYADVSAVNSTTALFTIFAFALQLYFDFSGYSDMARGVGYMLNIDIMKNFNSPYKAVDIIDFWKRWHISLTTFLTTYLYFPLGGNRKGKGRQYLNIMIVFLVSGLWHGAGLTFLIWGGLHGLFNILTRFVQPVLKKIPAFICKIFTFLLVTVLWVFFRASSFADALLMLKKPFEGNFGKLDDSLVESLLQPTLFNIITQVAPFLVAFSAVFVLSILSVMFLKNTDEKVESFKPTFFRSLISIALISLSVLSLTGFTSFVYAGF